VTPKPIPVYYKCHRHLLTDRTYEWDRPTAHDLVCLLEPSMVRLKEVDSVPERDSLTMSRLHSIPRRSPLISVQYFYSEKSSCFVEVVVVDHLNGTIAVSDDFAAVRCRPDLSLSQLHQRRSAKQCSAQEWRNSVSGPWSPRWRLLSPCESRPLVKRTCLLIVVAAVCTIIRPLHSLESNPFQQQ